MRYSALAAGLACALLAGCDSGEQPLAAGEAASLPFDSHPAHGDAVPRLEGSGGKLRYANGCLYLEERLGGRTGLIMPDSFRFDGRTLSNGTVAFALGSRVSFSGGWGSADPSKYACDMPMLFVDNVFAPPPPKDDRR